MKGIELFPKYVKLYYKSMDKYLVNSPTSNQPHKIKNKTQDKLEPKPYKKKTNTN